MSVNLVRDFVRDTRTTIMAALIVAALCAPAPAEDRALETPAAFGAVFQAWASEHAIGRGFLVVRHGGRTVYRLGIGGADPAAPVHLASLSKAITGVCIATLIDTGRLSFNTPLARAMPKFFARHGRPADPRIERITISQLLTHRAGFAGNSDRDDLVTGRYLAVYLRRQTAKAPPQPSLLVGAFNATLRRAPGQRYVYGNTAYAVLGAVIEEVTGRSYTDYCRDAVLAPMGAQGDMEPGWQVLQAYGGWRMSGENYLRFLDVFGSQQRIIGAAREWMVEPEGKMTSANGPAWYGLGTNIRATPEGLNVWHWGSWRYNLKSAKDGHLRASFVAYAARAYDGTGWFVSAMPRVEQGEPRRALNNAMFAAWRGVKRWD